MTHPPRIDFASFGLSDVQLVDQASQGFEPILTHRIEGTAVYMPPLDHELPGFWPRRVRFSMASASKPSAVRNFRKSRKIWEYITSQASTDIDTLHLVKNPDGAASLNSGGNGQGFPMHFAYKVLDFIEQPAGILAVCDLEYDVASTSLQTVFQDILHKDDEIKSQSLERYGKAVGYLIQIVNNLAFLHARGLVMILCKPENWEASPHDRPGETGTVCVARLQTVASFSNTAETSQLSSLPIDNVHDSIAPRPPELFSSDHFKDISIGRRYSDEIAGGGAHGLRLSFDEDTWEEAFIRANLSYFAPEVLVSRSASSLQVDIFSFGALAAELLTGVEAQKLFTQPDDTADLLDMLHWQITSPAPSVSDLVAKNPELPPKLAEIIVRCLSKDLDERYASTKSLLWDLRTFQKIAELGGDLGKFWPGRVDQASRFKLPQTLFARDEQITQLDRAMEVATGDDGTGRILALANVWGISGSGKTRLVQDWTRQLEASERPVLVSWSKFDQHTQQPVSGLTQTIDHLFKAIFSNPANDVDSWRREILKSVAGKRSLSALLIGPEWRALLYPHSSEEVYEPEPEWTYSVSAFTAAARHLLQLFATSEQPLVIVLDDVQWMDQEERVLWQEVLQGPLRLQHALVISLYRVESHTPPSSSLLLSLSASLFNIEVSSIASAVNRLIAESFGSSMPEPDAVSLESYLIAETCGNPFYLRGLLSSLVREAVIQFDFSALRWMFSIRKLEKMSGREVDSFLLHFINILSIDVQYALRVLATLPLRPIPVDAFAGLIGQAPAFLKTLLQPAVQLGAVTFSPDGRVCISHDRFRSVAYRLTPENERGSLHLAIARYLRTSAWADDLPFAIADNYLFAQSMGEPIGDPLEITILLCTAAQRASRSASYLAVLEYLSAADALVHFDDPELVWREARSTSMLFARLYAEACAVLSLTGDNLRPQAIERIEGFLSFNDISMLEMIQLETLIVRLLLPTNPMEAIRRATTVSTKAGYNPHDPPKWTVPEPVTTADFDDLEKRATKPLAKPPSVKDQVEESLSIMIAHIGSMAYILLGDNSRPFVNLGLRLCIESQQALHGESTRYLLTFRALDLSREFGTADICARYIELSKTIMEKGPPSSFDSMAIAGQVSIAHYTKPLREISWKASWEMGISLGDLSTAAYALGIHMCTALFSGSLYAKELLPISGGWYDIFPSLTATEKIFVNIARQTIEVIHDQRDLSQNPNRFDGTYLQRHRDWPTIENLSLHKLVWTILEIWCCVVHDAPSSEVLELVMRGSEFEYAANGLIFRNEFIYLRAATFLTMDRNGEHLERDAIVKQDMAELARFKTSDYQARLSVLQVSKAFREVARSKCKLPWMPLLNDLVEEAVITCREAGFPALVGHIYTLVAEYVMAFTNNEHLTRGYAIEAYEAYSIVNLAGPLRRVRRRFGNLIFPAPQISTMPKPWVTHNASATSGEPTPHSSPRSDASIAPMGTLDNQLTIDAVLKSMLTIASERETDVLVIKLMINLLGFYRADFGAIAIARQGSSVLDLRAAGSHSDLRSYDLPLAEAAGLAPVSVLQYLSATKSAITDPALLPRDSFITTLPRSVVALAIMNQGAFAGAIYLSSPRDDITASQSGPAIDVVRSLAVLACISVESARSTHSLEEIVKHRTQALQDALAARSTFLSHMSHELRTPLFAVLGLAAVLEDSPLDSSQREHLATIRRSGEDLQGLISDILDFSRLESGAITPEAIPFCLRDVAESTLEALASIAQKKKIDLVIETPVNEDVPLSIGDPFRIRQILLNFLSNSLKFSQEDSVVAVSWASEMTPEAKRNITVNVRDHGMGIPAEKMALLFKSFSQIESGITRRHDGSGLGLAISLSLAQLLGGTCTAVSKLGEGSTFTFNVIVEDGTPVEPIFTPLPTPRTAFILGKYISTPDWRTYALVKNLEAFGCSTWQEKSYDRTIDESNRHGLAAKTYDYVFIDTMLLDSFEQLQTIQRLQPQAQFRYLVRIVDKSKTIDAFRIPHALVIPRPLKAAAIRESLEIRDPVNRAAVAEALQTRSKMKGSAVLPNLSLSCPLRILLVDDNKVNTVVGRKILGRFGYTDDMVDVAFDGQQALQAAERQRYDLILMDLSMPIMDGIAARKRIEASPLTGSPRIVALTANTDKDTRDLCADFFAYLAKPINFDALAEVLRNSYQSKVEREASP